MAAESDNIGGLSVDVTADTNPALKSLEELEGRLVTLANKETALKIGLGNFEAVASLIKQTEQSIIGIGQGGELPPINIQGKFSLKIDEKSVAGAVQKALDAKPFTASVNVTIGNLDEIKAQLAGLTVPISLVAGDVALGNVQLMAAPGGSSSSAAPAQSKARADMVNFLAAQADNIGQVYSKLGEKLGASGRPLRAATDNVDKFLAVMERFGDTPLDLPAIQGAKTAKEIRSAQATGPAGVDALVGLGFKESDAKKITRSLATILTESKLAPAMIKEALTSAPPAVVYARSTESAGTARPEMARTTGATTPGLSDRMAEVRNQAAEIRDKKRAIAQEEALKVTKFDMGQFVRGVLDYKPKAVTPGPGRSGAPMASELAKINAKIAEAEQTAASYGAESDLIEGLIKRITRDNPAVGSSAAARKRAIAQATSEAKDYRAQAASQLASVGHNQAVGLPDEEWDKSAKQTAAMFETTAGAIDSYVEDLKSGKKTPKFDRPLIDMAQVAELRGRQSQLLSAKKALETASMEVDVTRMREPGEPGEGKWVSTGEVRTVQNPNSIPSLNRQRARMERTAADRREAAKSPDKMADEQAQAEQSFLQDKRYGAVGGQQGALLLQAAYSGMFSNKAMLITKQEKLTKDSKGRSPGDPKYERTVAMNPRTKKPMMEDVAEPYTLGPMLQDRFRGRASMTVEGLGKLTKEGATERELLLDAARRLGGNMEELVQEDLDKGVHSAFSKAFAAGRTRHHIGRDTAPIDSGVRTSTGAGNVGSKPSAQALAEQQAVQAAIAKMPAGERTAIMLLNRGEERSRSRENRRRIAGDFKESGRVADEGPDGALLNAIYRAKGKSPLEKLERVLANKLGVETGQLPPMEAVTNAYDAAKRSDLPMFGTPGQKGALLTETQKAVAAILKPFQDIGIVLPEVDATRMSFSKLAQTLRGVETAVVDEKGEAVGADLSYLGTVVSDLGDIARERFLVGEGSLATHQFPGGITDNGRGMGPRTVTGFTASERRINDPLQKQHAATRKELTSLRFDESIEMDQARGAEIAKALGRAGQTEQADKIRKSMARIATREQFEGNRAKGITPIDLEDVKEIHGSVSLAMALLPDEIKKATQGNIEAKQAPIRRRYAARQEEIESRLIGGDRGPVPAGLSFIGGNAGQNRGRGRNVVPMGARNLLEPHVERGMGIISDIYGLDIGIQLPVEEPKGGLNKGQSQRATVKGHFTEPSISSLTRRDKEAPAPRADSFLTDPRYLEADEETQAFIRRSFESVDDKGKVTYKDPLQLWQPPVGRDTGPITTGSQVARNVQERLGETSPRTDRAELAAGQKARTAATMAALNPIGPRERAAIADRDTTKSVYESMLRDLLPANRPGIVGRTFGQQYAAEHGEGPEIEAHTVAFIASGAQQFARALAKAEEYIPTARAMDQEAGQASWPAAEAVSVEDSVTAAQAAARAGVFAGTRASEPAGRSGLREPLMGDEGGGFAGMMRVEVVNWPAALLAGAAGAKAAAGNGASGGGGEPPAPPDGTPEIPGDSGSDAGDSGAGGGKRRKRIRTRRTKMGVVPIIDLINDDPENYEGLPVTALTERDTQSREKMYTGMLLNVDQKTRRAEAATTARDEAAKVKAQEARESMYTGMLLDVDQKANRDEKAAEKKAAARRAAQEQMYNGMLLQVNNRDARIESRDAVMRDRNYGRSVSRYNERVIPPVGDDERGEMYAGVWAEMDARDDYVQQRSATGSTYYGPRSGSPAARRARMAEARESMRSGRNATLFAQTQDQSQDEMAPVRADLRKAARSVPKRGFGASLTDVATSFFDRGALEHQLEYMGRAEEEAGELKTLTRRRDVLKTERTSAMEKARALPAGDARRGPLIDQARRANREMVDLAPAIKLSKDRLQQFTGEVTKGSTVIKSFAAAAGGSIISTAMGSVTMGLGMAITGPLIAAVGGGITAAVQPALERALGNPSITAQEVGMADQAVTAAKGNRGVAMSMYATQAGNMTMEQTELVGGLTMDQAEIEGGNKLIASMGGALLANRRLAANGISGITKGTSGIGGTMFGQVASTAEIIGGLLEQGAAPWNAPVPNAFIPDSTWDSSAGQQVKSLFSADIRQRMTTPDAASVFKEESEFTKTTLEAFNMAIERGGEGVNKFTLNYEKGNGWFEKLAGIQANILRVYGGEGGVKLAEQIEQGKTALIGANGMPLTDERDILRTLEAIPKGAPKADLAQVIEANQVAIDTQFWQENQRGQMARGQGEFEGRGIIESQFGIEMAASPIGSATSGIPKGSRGGMRETMEGYAEIDRLAEEGITQAKAFVSMAGQEMNRQLDPAVVEDFNAALDKTVSLGREISNIQIGREEAHAAYATKQYNFQLYQTNRSLKDAVDLRKAAFGGGGGNTLGGIQGQQWALQRESQSLSLGMSQKQINFQTATAGLTVPGETPEMRAARIQQRKLEAEYAQKQLDIQKKLFGLEGKGFKITVDRSVFDLTRQLNLLTEGRAITIDDAKAQKKIRLLNLQMARELKIVNNIFEQAQTRANDMLDLTAKFANELVRDAALVFNQLLSYYRRYYENLPTGGGRGGGTPMTVVVPTTDAGRREVRDNIDYNGNMVIGRASGDLFNTTGVTSPMVVGEAGKETVAILRNPRNMSPGGTPAGGSSTITINFNNATVRRDEDLRTIAREVERILGQRASLIYGRNF